MKKPTGGNIIAMNIHDTNNVGNFSVSRSIWTSDLFAREPFTEREAWIWMISSAVWKDQTVRVGKHVVRLERGQLCYSTRFMAEAFGWHHSRLRRFLDRLEIRSATGRKTGTAAGTAPTVITITNYDQYQDWKAQPTQDATQLRHSSDTQTKESGSVELNATLLTVQSRDEFTLLSVGTMPRAVVRTS